MSSGAGVPPASGAADWCGRRRRSQVAPQPPGYPLVLHPDRVKRCFNRLKQVRRVAT